MPNSAMSNAEIPNTVRSQALYQGSKHCLLTHEPSQSSIETDAPKDNHGLGERFSPTDLLGAALTSCMLTTMAIQMEPEGVQLTGAKAEVEKEMTGPPRRIKSLRVRVFLPAHLTEQQRVRCQEIARTCPVHRSLSAEMAIPIEFIYSP
jgi:putative redox protein